VLRLTAGWLVSMAGPPIRNGAILIAPTGRVVAVGPDHAVPAPPGSRAEAFPDAILFPGLVNAHTHLELTGLAGRVSRSSFPDWIRGVRELKSSLEPDWFREAAREGVRNAFAAGITTVLDTGDSGAVLPALVELGGSGVAYQEVFGPHPEQLAESMEGLERRVAVLRDQTTDRVRLGVSPHAPYTVSGPLYRAVARFARREGLSIAVHVAESEAETELVVANRGAFADAWRARGIPPIVDQIGPPPGFSVPSSPPHSACRSPLSWLDYNGVLGRDTLCIHAVRSDDADIALLADRGAGVAHCPASNARHGHGDAPLPRLLGKGIRVGLGTDSVISVGQLDLFAEMRAARAIGRLTASEALSLATIGGAQLTGWGAEVGWLKPGAFGDCVLLEPVAPVVGDPEEAIVAANPGQVLVTYVTGRQVFRRPA